MWHIGAFLRGVTVPVKQPWQVTLITGHETKGANVMTGCVLPASLCPLLIQAEGTHRDLPTLVLLPFPSFKEWPFSADFSRVLRPLGLSLFSGYETCLDIIPKKAKLILCFSWSHFRSPWTSHVEAFQTTWTSL